MFCERWRIEPRWRRRLKSKKEDTSGCRSLKPTLRDSAASVARSRNIVLYHTAFCLCRCVCFSANGLHCARSRSSGLWRAIQNCCWARAWLLSCLMLLAATQFARPHHVIFHSSTCTHALKFSSSLTTPDLYPSTFSRAFLSEKLWEKKWNKLIICF